MNSARFPLVLVVALMVLAGCDNRPKRVAVTGRVLIDGEPLEQGVIQFTPTGTRPSYGHIENGQFTMRCFEDDDGVITGSHRVSINSSEIISSNKIKWFAPKKYSHPDTSGLAYEILEPQEDLLIEITWDGGKPYIEQSGRARYEETSDDI